MKNILKILILVVIVVIIVLIFSLMLTKQKIVTISSFGDCALAGNPVMESYPRQCNTKDGRHFVEYIGNELEQIDLITVNVPRPNSLISSPLVISGSARGYWFFEASAPVFLYDDNNNLISTGIITTIGDWMTEDFVRFTTELSFIVPETQHGLLVMKNNNPSDLRDNDRELIIPITFR